jgi:hypothetical protein
LAPYKKQHYLPVAYLQQFSADKANVTRESKVWRFDGKESKLVPAESQCRENYFYSKDQATAAETMFQPAEGFLAECVRSIKARNPSTKAQFFGLILIMFDLHLRNAAYENETGKDNLHAYMLRLGGLKQLLLGRNEKQATNGEVMEHLRKHWRVRLLLASPGNEFITSDNPSVLIAAPGTISNLQLAVLPVTPTHIAIAYDCQQIEVVGERTTPMDEKLLNTLQLSHAERCVHSSVQLNMEQQQFVAEQLNRKSNVRCKTDETAWEASMRKLESDAKFSFLRPVIAL